MATEALSEQAFEKVADDTLRALERAVGNEDDFEADLQSGILTIEFPDGTKYVVNSHRAARQIWMAAERAAWHFDYRPAEGRWVAEKSDDELWATIESVLARKLGRPVPLRR